MIHGGQLAVGFGQAMYFDDIHACHLRFGDFIIEKSLPEINGFSVSCIFEGVGCILACQKRQ
jgi:hypothetical protein